jgi:hypothetical protein
VLLLLLIEKERRLRSVGNVIGQVLRPLDQPVDVLALLNVQLTLLVAWHQPPLGQVQPLVVCVIFNFFLNLFLLILILKSYKFRIELLVIWLLLLLMLLFLGKLLLLLLLVLRVFNVNPGSPVNYPLVEVIQGWPLFLGRLLIIILLKLRQRG